MLNAIHVTMQRYLIVNTRSTPGYRFAPTVRFFEDEASAVAEKAYYEELFLARHHEFVVYVMTECANASEIRVLVNTAHSIADKQALIASLCANRVLRAL